MTQTTRAVALDRTSVINYREVVIIKSAVLVASLAMVRLARVMWKVRH